MACYTAGVAQVPPPFTPQQPAKPKSNTTLIVVIILAVVGLPCVAVIALVGFGAKVWNTTLSPMAGCMLSITEIRNATLTYAEQNGGKLPAAKTWQDDVRPFYSKQMELEKFTGTDELIRKMADLANATLQGANLSHASLEGAVLRDEHGVAFMDQLVGAHTGRALPPLATIDLVGPLIERETSASRAAPWRSASPSSPTAARCTASCAIGS